MPVDQSTIYLVSAVAYTAGFLALLYWYRRIPERLRSYSYPLFLVLGAATVGALSLIMGLGTIPVGEGTIDLPSLGEDLIAYPLVYAVAAMLANPSRRMLGAVVAIPTVQRVAFSVASVSSGSLSLFAALVVMGGHLLLIYLFVGPIWADTDGLPPRQRLLHWKCRNLLLFLIGMLIVLGMLLLAGIFDPFVSTVITEYIDLMIRLGFAGFVMMHLPKLGREEHDATDPEEGAPGTVTETAGV